MKIVLINPHILNQVRGPLPAALSKGSEMMPPLGLLYVAGFIKEKTGHQVSLIDADALSLGHEELMSRIKEINPQMIGLTVTTHTLYDSAKTVKMIKNTFPDISIVLGGPHVTLFPKESAMLEGVDFCISGEGEIPFAMLADTLEKGSDLSVIPGLSYFEKGTVKINDENHFVSDINMLPFPAREISNIELYRTVLSDKFPVTSMITSRGCPYKCSFCDRPLLKGGKWRSISAESVVREMEECRKLGIKEIAVYDDTFSVDRLRALEICRLKKAVGNDLNFSIRTRADLVDEELIKALKDAGCTAIHFGVESGSETVLERMNKQFSLEKVLNSCELAKKYGLEVLTYFMIGNPGEKADDIEKTGNLIKKIDPDYLHLTILMPFPGTEVYNEMLNTGMLRSDVWREFAKAPLIDFNPPVWTENFSEIDLIKIRHKFYRSFYFRPVYIFKQIAKIKSYRDFVKKFLKGLQIFTFFIQNKFIN